jgi:hypothetical protein
MIAKVLSNFRFSLPNSIFRNDSQTNRQNIVLKSAKRRINRLRASSFNLLREPLGKFLKGLVTSFSGIFQPPPTELWSRERNDS